MKKELFSELKIDFASPLPVYEQIKKNIKHAIAKQVLAENDPLPSIRELASFLKINPNTVARAYRDLAQEDLISGRAGLGSKVKATGPLEKEKSAMLQEEFMRFLEKAIEMGFSRQHLRAMMEKFFQEEK